MRRWCPKKSQQPKQAFFGEMASVYLMYLHMYLSDSVTHISLILWHVSLWFSNMYISDCAAPENVCHNNQIGSIRPACLETNQKVTIEKIYFKFCASENIVLCMQGIWNMRVWKVLSIYNSAWCMASHILPCKIWPNFLRRNHMQHAIGIKMNLLPSLCFNRTRPNDFLKFTFQFQSQNICRKKLSGFNRTFPENNFGVHLQDWTYMNLNLQESDIWSSK